jgi:hypothetical protein
MRAPALRLTPATSRTQAMIYKFKSKATGDVIMLGPNGDQLLRLLGREPASRGIIELEAMPQARRQIEQALADADAAAQRTRSDGAPGGTDDELAQQAVSLRQRVWPMLQMLERAEAAGEPVVWGV